MRSVMQHSFSNVPSVEIPRSVFDRSHGYKTTFDAGYLVPFFYDEALPGDTFSVHPTIFARLATPLKPIMDNLFLDVFFFAVPNRLVWDNWQKFCGERVDPDDSIDFLVPQITAPSGGWATGSVHDYFGLPVGVTGIKANALHFRAMNLIWNEFFRDQNLSDSLTVAKGDSGDPTYSLLKRAKRHDYFTSALPWPQKGDAVQIPLTGTVPVMGNGKTLGLTDDPTDPAANRLFGIFTGTSLHLGSYSTLYNTAIGSNLIGGGNSPSVDIAMGVTPDGEKSGLIADLSDVNAITINDLREAFQTQRMLERDARGGTRYTEILQNHFRVTSPDQRLQRPEYLGGGTIRVNINPVAQTSASPATPTTNNAQGNLAGFGTAAGQGNGFSKSFVEHSVIIGFINCRADLTYQQGLNRMWSRQTRYDYYWPAFAHLGEQEVLNQEIYADGSSADSEVFGYQERYAEYRYKPSMITGLFRHYVTSGYTTLDQWHLSQVFGTRPALNEAFILDDTETILDRVVAVPSEPDFIMDSHINVRCARPMPVYSVPGLIDHF